MCIRDRYKVLRKVLAPLCEKGLEDKRDWELSELYTQTDVVMEAKIRRIRWAMNDQDFWKRLGGSEMEKEKEVDQNLVAIW